MATCCRPGPTHGRGLLAALVFFSASAVARAEPPGEVALEDFVQPVSTSPYAFRDFPDRVLFGDMHIHSNLSPDAGLLGTSLSPEDVYRAARGETVRSNTGQPFRLVRPLDFLVLTDHAEAMGLATMIRDSSPVLLASTRGREVWQGFNGGPEAALQAFGSLLADLSAGTDPFADIDMAGSIWPEFVELADRYNQPGVFTAMTGFEWTSQPDGNNLHRIVVFADGADKTSRVRPFSALDSQDPAELWNYMENYEALTGGRVFAHVHNGNLSNGIAFTAGTFDGTPMDADYAARRSRWEPIMEITQIKGDGETHPILSPDDEFASFERWDVTNLDGSAPKTPEMLRYEYARTALLTGLEVEARVGVNPYDFGFNGTTDSHTGLASSGEENYFGKFPGTEPGPDRFFKTVVPAADPSLRIISAQESAAGLTGAWVRENTRDEIFDAMLRKEIFATTGTRLRVRLFAGWDFKPGDELMSDFSGLGYTRGIPMGGRLDSPPQDAAPTFIVRAERDPDWANLDRIQIIKGWIDADGSSRERIYDIAVAGGREIGPDGRAREPVGSTVDLATATFTNTIGAPFLAGYWRDPDFDLSERAFYYVRVLEIPTPRWTTYDAVRFGLDLPEEVPSTVQDRAYSSPVWFTPAGGP
ncbi:DUF3604 domain-containing protein [Paracoccus benzoatiresistens]|uniref:DUF3604 domain-containing protein n=1 Tax=Paracoccus benzoatiresistens TaxID=2997341 RepID=A0ABT4JCC6_9RHOB|nr:DUF3604 domain-containing protein [Paracoccus sp. EF6]MCZ0964370.1 DUF3604 domain-containing protein [Paracoccus sp. EF6]